MRRSVPFALASVVALLLLGLAPAPASASGDASGHAAAVQYLRSHGYLPTVAPATLAQRKAQAAAQAGLPADAAGPLTPVASPSFQGQDENDLAPSDSTGAAGPSSFIEMINTRIAIYNRSGGLMASAPSEALTGTAHGDLSDPQVMWDPTTNRFYYEILNVNNDTIQFGFSKSGAPTAIPGSFCNYDADFGYGANLPDFPKMGDTTHSLLIGVNVFTGGVTFAGSDVDFITKPAGTGTITTCPARGTFLTGKVSGLKTTTGAQAATPNPAQQADGSTTGWVAATPNNLPATALELYRVTENSNGTPVIPVTATAAVTVASFNAPASAPQKGGSTNIDTLDGRLLHAVTAIDPAHNAVALWTAHSVSGGAGAESRWYEVNVASHSLFQSGKATSSSLFVFNPAIAPDRVVSGTHTAFGSDMVMGFTTSSSAAFPADQMVSKIGTAAQSGFVLVKQSPGADQGFDCLQLGICRWGDYSGATPDPGSSLTGTHGHVWLANMWSKGGGANGSAAEWGTWVWQAAP